MKISQEFSFADFGIFEFGGNTFSRIWFQTLLLGIIFSRISCVVFESDKNGRFRYTVCTFRGLLYSFASQ